MSANSYSGLSCTTSTLNVDSTGSSSSAFTFLTSGGPLTSSVTSDLLFSAVSGTDFTSQVFYGSLSQGTQRSAIPNILALNGPSMWAADFQMGVEPDTESQTMAASQLISYGGAAIAAEPSTTVSASTTVVATPTWQGETHSSPAATSTGGGTLALPSAYATAGNATLLSVAISDDSTPTSTATTTATSTATTAATTAPTSTATSTATATATTASTTIATTVATTAPTTVPALPACVLVTHGVGQSPVPNGGNVQNPGVTLEQPPNLPTASQTTPLTATENDKCCSIVYPPFICDYHSATCYYINPPFVHTGEP